MSRPVTAPRKAESKVSTPNTTRPKSSFPATLNGGSLDRNFIGGVLSKARIAHHFCRFAPNRFGRNSNGQVLCALSHTARKPAAPLRSDQKAKSARLGALFYGEGYELTLLHLGLQDLNGTAQLFILFLLRLLRLFRGRVVVIIDR